MGESLYRAATQPLTVTLNGGPKHGEEIQVDVFTIGVTDEESGAYYKRRSDEVWIFDYSHQTRPEHERLDADS